MRPHRILDVAVSDRRPVNDVRDENAAHDQRGHDSPGVDPVVVGLVTGHLLHAVAEPPRAKNPADSDGLEKAHPQNGQSAGAVKVEQLEDEGPALRDHRHAHQEQRHAHQCRELLPSGPQKTGENVDQARDETLHDAKLAVDADGDQHDEEGKGPKRASGQFEHHLRVRNEY